MYVAHLSLHDFRSYPAVEVEIGPGVTAFVGRNGQGKTNLVEAIDYLSSLSSHRVASDAPLVRQGAQQAIVRAAVIRDERRAVLEIEINPGKSNRARINKSPLPKAKELLGLVRTVVFAPDDLSLVKGDPSERRKFADDLLVQISPRFAGIRADYERVLKQRNSLLKTARTNRRARDADETLLSTLAVWDSRLSELGAEILRRRLQLVADLAPLIGKAYEAVARGARRDDTTVDYKPSLDLVPDVPLEQQLLDELGRRRADELERGLTLVGPHRDDLLLGLGDLPVKGYASHGESWSFALALRLASYDLLRASGDDPVLILDDVFAELDSGRRAQLADLVADAEQVLITAAVPEDIPEQLRGRRFIVAGGEVTLDE
ncbi:DNA replication/repair protein RecF [Nocardioides marmoriginsengisoli]|uniref:DNA replication and repair protein RecF n=1 Tax=Nocardioides marmoriginsengisoli TaxID=661483 RepID=A0A3N0CCN5_9ACTN|nr:DNA replication/repair protein RecF [Nocardioides marmoriginsengisoli]RNL60753.1 DNA replication/repair protein RecF [Nocardioides marmoriginsengisoli]